MARSSLRLGALARDVSIWWLAIPILIYLFLTRNIPSTLLLSAIGAGLKYAQTRKEVPSAARPYLPLLQPVMALLFLGSNPIVVIAVLAAVVVAIRQRNQVIPALEPWWQIQQRLSLTVRRVIAAVITLLIGYFFGLNASGNEWTYTFLSIAMGTAVAFLLMFTPPASLRRSRSRSSP